MPVYFHPSGRITCVPDTLGRMPDSSELKRRKSKGFIVNYWQVADKAACLFFEKRNKIVFITLTFARVLTHKEANKVFSKFIDNCKLNYSLAGYVAVCEYQKNGNPHYHCLFDIPKFNIQKLQKAWNNAASQNSKSSLDIGGKDKDGNRRNAIINNVSQCVKYICKYTTKNKDIVYSSRCVFSSHFINESIKISGKTAELFEKYVIFKQVTNFKEFQLSVRYIHSKKIQEVFDTIKAIDIKEADKNSTLKRLKAESDFKLNRCRQVKLFEKKPTAVPVETKKAVKREKSVKFTAKQLQDVLYKYRNYEFTA